MLRNDVGPPIVHYVPVIRPVPTGANVLGQFPLFDYDPPPTLPVYQAHPDKPKRKKHTSVRTGGSYRKRKSYKKPHRRSSRRVRR